MAKRSVKKKKLKGSVKVLSIVALLFVAVGVSMQAYTSFSPKEVAVKKKAKNREEGREKRVSC